MGKHKTAVGLNPIKCSEKYCHDGNYPYQCNEDGDVEWGMCEPCKGTGKDPVITELIETLLWVEEFCIAYDPVPEANLIYDKVGGVIDKLKENRE